VRPARGLLPPLKILKGSKDLRHVSICKGSQVPGSTFKVGNKDRIDEPKKCQNILSLPNGFHWAAGFRGWNGEPRGFHGTMRLQSGIGGTKMQP